LFYFSFHPNTRDLGNHALYARGFLARIHRSIEDLAEDCTARLNSPVVWIAGIRKASNFVFSEFAVIDIDQGEFSLAEAQNVFKDFVHIIGTTKSHQRLKGNKIADRFRIFVALERRVTSAKEYAATNESLARQYGGDLQAIAAHMAFMPLRQIVSVSSAGKKFPVAKFEPPQVSKPIPKALAMGSGHRIPHYIQRWLDGGCPDGERNLTCFKAACGLLKRGFNEDEVMNLLLSSAIPISTSTEVVQEIRSVVRNAARRQ